LSDTTLLEAVQRVKAPATPAVAAPVSKPRPEPVKKPEPISEDERESQVLALCMARPELLKAAIEDYQLRSDEFQLPQHGELYEQLKNSYDPSKSKSSLPGTSSGLSLAAPPHLSGDLASLFDRLAFFAERDFLTASLSELQRELQTLLQTLRIQKKTAQLRRLEQAMREAERAGNQELIAQLMEQFRALNS
jgi:hypothetical protein